MYCRKAELDQRPKAWTTESGIPAWDAVVAAPMRKLWAGIACQGNTSTGQHTANQVDESRFRQGCTIHRA